MILLDHQDFASLIKFREVNLVKHSLKGTAIIACRQVIFKFINISKAFRSSNIMSFLIY